MLITNMSTGPVNLYYIFRIIISYLHHCTIAIGPIFTDMLVIPAGKMCS